MSAFDDYRDLCEERDQLRAELELAKRERDEAREDSALSHKHYTDARAELAELRAQAGELERQVRDKHEAATVDEICNAYESGVGHRGRPTANVNPYRQGTAGHVAYRLGATGTKHNAPQDDARDAERYRYIRDNAKDGAVKTLLPLYRAHYFVSLEPISECPTFDAAIDAAILASKVKP